jgi:hypothetical protein
MPLILAYLDRPRAWIEHLSNFIWATEKLWNQPSQLIIPTSCAQLLASPCAMSSLHIINNGNLHKHGGALSTCIPTAISVIGPVPHELNVQFKFLSILSQNTVFHSKAPITPNQLNLLPDSNWV